MMNSWMIGWTLRLLKAYMYDEVVDDMKGMETLNYSDIVIGK
jgi:hypothetical protein